MNTLIYDNYYRMKRSLLLIGVIIAMMALPALMLILEKVIHGDKATIDVIYIEGLLFMPMIFAVAAGHFIAHDYTNNTIRNKLIIGHTRVNIYLSNFIAMTAFLLVVFILNEIVALGAGAVVIGTKGLESDVVIKNLLFCVPMLVGVSSITVFVSMTIKGSGGMVLNFMIQYAFMAVGIFKNDLPDYFKGILGTVSDFIPSVHLMLLNPVQLPENPVSKTVYAVIVTIATTVGGIEIFKRADLK